jgi:hypothetical protein
VKGEAASAGEKAAADYVITYDRIVKDGECTLYQNFSTLVKQDFLEWTYISKDETCIPVH